MRSNAYIAARQAVRVLLDNIRTRRPVRQFDLSKVATSQVKTGYLHGRTVERLIVILRSSGCAWALEPGGGCTVCGHLAGTTQGEAVAPELFKRQFLGELRRHGMGRFPMLCVYNSGSLLNPTELPVEARHEIFEAVGSMREVQCLVIESRPEFVTTEVLEEIEYFLGKKRVEIGVGLESSSDVVRDLCLNKGFSAADFRAVASRCGDSKVKLLAYVLIKPPFLLEREAFQDAVESARFAFEAGAEIVSFEPVSVQDFTLVHFLHEAGVYRPPWLWTVFEVARHTAALGEIRLGGFEFMPIPRLFAHNCAQCDAGMVEALEGFNGSGELARLDDEDCTCFRDWETEWGADTLGLALPARIVSLLSYVDTPRVLERIGTGGMSCAACLEACEGAVCEIRGAVGPDRMVEV